LLGRAARQLRRTRRQAGRDGFGYPQGQRQPFPVRSGGPAGQHAQFPLAQSGEERFITAGRIIQPLLRRTDQELPLVLLATAKYTWKYGYDAAGNPASVTDPLGHQRKTGYDAVGNVASVTDARDKQTVYEYDELNRPKTVTAPDTGATAFTYNKAGFLETSTDANTHTSIYGYNDEGQLASVKNPLGTTRRSSHRSANVTVPLRSLAEPANRRGGSPGVCKS
jgi:YD repeat-containing protein